MYTEEPHKSAHNADTTPTSARRLTYGHLLGHNAGPLVQFLKYAVAGGMATALHIGIFYICALWLIPSLTQDDFVVKLFGLEVDELEKETRATRAAVTNTISFFFSNTFCYFLNRLFVFKPGRHHWFMEFMLFMAVAAVSLVIGTAMQSWLIAFYGLQTTVAFSANILVSLMINYAMRRFVVFKG